MPLQVSTMSSSSRNSISFPVALLLFYSSPSVSLVLLSQCCSLCAGSARGVDGRWLGAARGVGSVGMRAFLVWAALASANSGRSGNWGGPCPFLGGPRFFAGGGRPRGGGGERGEARGGGRHEDMKRAT